MTRDEYNRLKGGDLVRRKGEENLYRVVVTGLERPVVVHHRVIFEADQWELVHKGGHIMIMSDKGSIPDAHEPMGRQGPPDPSIRLPSEAPRPVAEPQPAPVGAVTREQAEVVAKWLFPSEVPTPCDSAYCAVCAAWKERVEQVRLGVQMALVGEIAGTIFGHNADADSKGFTPYRPR